MSAFKFSVWEFRVRYHLERHGDTKKSREFLVTKFGPEHTVLVQAVLDLHDAARAQEKAERALNRLRRPYLEIETVLDRAESDLWSRLSSEQSDEDTPLSARLADFPPRLKTGWNVFQKSLDTAAKKLRATLESFGPHVKVAEQDLARAQRLRERAFVQARAAYAALDQTEVK